MPFLYVLLFGIVGISLRFGLNTLAIRTFAEPFPTITFGINTVGSFVIGVLYVLGEREALTPDLKIGLFVGLLGGFTTFSAYSLEVFRLWEQSRLLHACLYALLSPAFGILAASLGVFTTRLIWKI